ncbi:Galactose transporter [Leclercia adecarboxylata]|uniref:Galactose transporter n=1 Tax=Leclercia adecarboxylata TaxID=83655 RepID=A0A4U9IJF7_9ENTR|nr:Galactose transporter [Leclercia adecarboxylata]
MLCSEIQPLKGRDFGITCSTATNWIANMIVGATFLTMLDTLGNANTFWVYGGLNLLFIVLTLWLVPETKHVSLEHIERNLMKGRPCAKSALTTDPAGFLPSGGTRLHRSATGSMLCRYENTPSPHCASASRHAQPA